jgi:hypothetical protein
VTVDSLNAVLGAYGLPLIDAKDLAPLKRAA